MTRVGRMMLLVGLLFAAGLPAWGCSCLGNPQCERVKVHAAMFVGRVLSGREFERPDHGFNMRRRAFLVEVTESFGGARQGDRIEVTTGIGGGDCGYPFKIGDSYLVDAFKGEDGLETGICDLTEPEWLAAQNIQELRTISTGRRVPDLAGLVVRSDSSFGSLKPLADVPVTLTSASGGARLETRTDAAGQYSFATVKPGRYRLDPVLPPDVTSWEITQGTGWIVEVPAGRAVGAGCKVRVYARPKNGISGVVVDAAGRPVSGSVSAFAAGEKDWPGSRATAKVAADGTFQMWFLSPGEYKLQLYKPDAGAGRRWYFPDSATLEGAQKVMVRDGLVTEGIRFVVVP